MEAVPLKWINRLGSFPEMVSTSNWINENGKTFVKGGINKVAYDGLWLKNKKEGVESMFKSLFFNRSKKRSNVFLLLAFVIAFVPMALNFPTDVQAATTLKVYPAPSGVTLNTAYTVQVRVPGGVWQDLDEYQTIGR